MTFLENLMNQKHTKVLRFYFAHKIKQNNKKNKKKFN